MGQKMQDYARAHPAPPLAKQGEFGGSGGGAHDDGAVHVPAATPSKLKPGINNGGDANTTMNAPATIEMGKTGTR